MRSIRRPRCEVSPEFANFEKLRSAPIFLDMPGCACHRLNPEMVDVAEIRFNHKVLGDRRFHVITSPDLPGLHVTADSREQAEREAVDVVAMIMRKREHGRIAGVLVDVC